MHSETDYDKAIAAGKLVQTILQNDIDRLNTKVSDQQQELNSLRPTGPVPIVDLSGDCVQLNTPMFTNLPCGDNCSPGLFVGDSALAQGDSWLLQGGTVSVRGIQTPPVEPNRTSYTPPPIGEYAEDQWWLCELEKVWTGQGEITLDMKRAAKVALNFAHSVLAQRAMRASGFVDEVSGD